MAILSKNNLGHLWAVVKVDPEKSQVTWICAMLRDERQQKGISQQRLSELSGLSRTGVRHVESLETNPTLLSLLKIAKALKVDLSELLKDSQL